MALSDDLVFAIDKHTKNLIVKEGIFEKGYCSQGKDWKIKSMEKFVDIVQIKSNNLGCLWALNKKNQVRIISFF